MVRGQLESRGITDEAVLDAFREVPREQFVDPEYRGQAYRDRALPIRCGQTISQPYMVAVMTRALELEPGHRVLEIGTGSGYQTAILVALGGEVYTVEQHPQLAKWARDNLERTGYADDVQFRVGDGSQGWPNHAPYDRILVTAGAPDVPGPLKRQTRIGGRIVIPVGSRSGQTIQVLTRRSEDEFEVKSSVSCVFVPLTGESGWDDADESGGFW